MSTKSDQPAPLLDIYGNRKSEPALGHLVDKSPSNQFQSNLTTKVTSPYNSDAEYWRPLFYNTAPKTKPTPAITTDAIIITAAPATTRLARLAALQARAAARKAVIHGSCCGEHDVADTNASILAKHIDGVPAAAATATADGTVTITNEENHVRASYFAGVARRGTRWMDFVLLPAGQTKPSRGFRDSEGEGGSGDTTES